MARGRKTGGRKRGTPNRATKALRDMVLEALDAAGGVDYLRDVATADPATFCRLLLKLMPQEVEAKVQGSTLEGLLAASWGLEVGERSPTKPAGRA